MSDTIVMIHARFNPEGVVYEIGERPMELTPQAWFNQLNGKFGNCYQALAGGRGVYRIPQSELAAIKAALPQPPQA